jgi:hypothetical protein
MELIHDADLAPGRRDGRDNGRVNKAVQRVCSVKAAGAA